MTKVTCSLCGYPNDEETATVCPECDNCLCEECSGLYNGYCRDCYDEVSYDFQ